MKRLVRLVAIIGMAGVALFSATTGALADAPEVTFTPTFQAAECPASLLRVGPYGEIAQRELTVNPNAFVLCGYVTVPERHALPDGRKIEIAVAVVKARAKRTVADPIAYLDGGPGLSSISSTLPVLLGPAIDIGNRVARDVIVIEQRGNFHSRPALTCPEVFEASKGDLTIDSRRPLVVAAYATCHGRLARSGIDLSAYNSLETAADVPMVVRALGYDRYNVYGVSHGTLIAQHLMRDHPEGIRSVVLNSVMPLDVNVNATMPTSAQGAFGNVFKACAEDEACHAAYPDLEGEYLATVARLNTTPYKSFGQNGQFSITGDDLIRSTLEKFDHNGLQVVPLNMRLASVNSLSGLTERFASVPEGPRNEALGLFYSTICAEDADFEAGDLQTNTPITRAIANARPREILEVCHVWEVDTLAKYVDTPLVSDIPTLLMTGVFDGVTPPAFLPRVASGLSRSYSYVYAGGHAERLFAFGGLPFIEDPSKAPDEAIFRLKPLPFVITGPIQALPVITPAR